MYRYFYYHVFYIGMMNVMLFVPHILIKHRFDGAVSGILAGIVIGTVLTVGTVYCYRQFPELGLPEILKRYFPDWIVAALLYLSCLLWLAGGVLGSYTFAQTMGLFFNPDMNHYQFLLLIIVSSVFAGSRSTRTIQFANEILFWLCMPLLLFILFKAFSSPYLSWDAIRIVAGYVAGPPSLTLLAASTFFYTGYLNLTLFNRLYPAKFRIKRLWSIPLLGAFLGFVSFFIPIGLHGTMGVEQYIYLWSVTADSMSLKYGFIQRILFIFLIMFTLLSLMFMMNVFHACMEYIKASHPRHKPQPEQLPVPKTNWIVCSFFGAACFLFSLWANEGRSQWATELWLIVRFLFELGSFVLIIVLALLEKRRSSPSSRSTTSSASSGQ
ncbi:GerAB/ArcD/ProY family transporter [Cohnella thailandensis]|uniref:GerAB/ArcD/ProY family transporter n=1 Tax=Cohnella thailandensis TaxID=557557 RepID=A0A841SYM0_9BACL|nr:GerAB/ArcD/ProY family transporter [Cohnella thailandensis]MBB6633861.1 GerAB/ArcD/ProY family transporter [Cohnella thailandensis]MBP1972544.1 hypothetical protein [Cohnella thailandensis]